ncbi:hypothetical protein KAW48_08560, partial [candidate division WOR-3 bacterium]|nr:hypothetical protein [candidate division WOR-3 bacterium]
NFVDPWGLNWQSNQVMNVWGFSDGDGWGSGGGISRRGAGGLLDASGTPFSVTFNNFYAKERALFAQVRSAVHGPLSAPSPFGDLEMKLASVGDVVEQCRKNFIEEWDNAWTGYRERQSAIEQKYTDLYLSMFGEGTHLFLPTDPATLEGLDHWHKDITSLNRYILWKDLRKAAYYYHIWVGLRFTDRYERIQPPVPSPPAH